MKLVTVRDGGRTVYVNKDCIKEVILNPQIQRVPNAPPDVRGVIIYEDNTLVLYGLDSSAQASCGVIMSVPNRGSMWGITGEPDGEEEWDTQELTEVMPGIWEICRDKTE